MKNLMNLFVSLILLMATSTGYSQKVIFLHHSTGNNVFKEGNVVSWIDSYNKANGKALKVTERSFPNEPWDWSNYPFDYWKLWINGSCNSANPNIECLQTLVANYNMVILKHCFPGADIKPNSGRPDVTSNVKTIDNYKEQYRALRSLFDSYPGTKFMVWTLAPLHRMATSPETARLANEFVQWVKNEWLKEDNKPHPNIYIYDFFGLVAEMNENPANGVRYCLKYDFERSHTDGDSHPNLAANQYAGPLFGKAIADAFK
jgi:hypothetical protein